MAHLIRTENHKQLSKLKAVNESSKIATVADTAVQFDDIMLKRFAVAHTPHDELPSFAGLLALIAVNGQCRLHEYDDFAKLWNVSADINKHAKIDINNDSILRGVYAIFDVSYIDPEKDLLIRNENISGDLKWWSKYVAQFIASKHIDRLFEIAKQITPTNLIL